MPRAVFISHSSADRDLVKDFVRLLEAGIGVAQGDVFCTSMPGSKVNIGRGFVEAIRQEAEGARVVIALISPSFMDSPFCWSELGAGWVLSTTPARLIPIVVDPVGFSDVANTVVGGLQTLRLNPADLSQLRDEFSETLNVKVPTDRWDDEKDTFLERHMSEDAIESRQLVSLPRIQEKTLGALGLSAKATAEEVHRAVSALAVARPESYPDGFTFDELVAVLRQTSVEIKPGDKMDLLSCMNSYRAPIAAGVQEAHGIPHHVAASLMPFGLTESEAVPGMAWKRIKFTAAGLRFAGELQRRLSAKSL